MVTSNWLKNWFRVTYPEVVLYKQMITKDHGLGFGVANQPCACYLVLHVIPALV